MKNQLLICLYYFVAEFAVVTLSEKSVDSADWELESGSAGSGFRLGLALSSAFTFSGHDSVANVF